MTAGERVFSVVRGRLYERLPALALPPVLEEALPEGADRGQLLAALQEAGVLKRGQISLETEKAAP